MFVVTDIERFIVDETEQVVVTVADERTVLTEAAADIVVVSVGEQGPPGAPGAVGNTNIVRMAGVALGGQRLVTTDAAGNAIYADNQVAAHANRVLGLTEGAASLGAPVSIRTGGEYDEPSWNWVPDTVLFLGTNGLLSATAPVNGFSLPIGYAITATKIFIAVKQPVVLV